MSGTPAAAIAIASSVPSQSLSTNASGPSKKMTSSGSKAAEQQSGGDKKPAAWSKTSINPLTQRASGSPIQNGVKSNGATPANAVKPPTTNTKDIASSDTLLFLLANFKGLNATLLLRNGDRYTGIFSSASNGQYIIKMAKKLPAHGKQANGVSDETAGSGPDRTLAINIQDVVDLSVADVRLNKTQNRGPNGAASGFQTDADIAAGWRGRERELQKWEPAEDGADVDHSIENGHIGGWDQFAAHKKMTGLESTYDENNYTTALNRSKPGYDEAARKADQIAREIEGTSATNAHVAEERGIKVVDDSGLDEEAKYSGVQRDYKPLPSGSANRYTPPAMRPPTGQATVPGAPVDPAIISSALADPSKSKTRSVSPTKKADESIPAAQVEGPQAAIEKEAPAPSVSSDRPEVEKPTAPASVTSSNVTMPPTLPSTRVANKEGGATATVEKDVHEAFKEFTKSEKLRVQEHQRSLARRDKAVKLNDLKKFAQNFKLHTEVPADLLPILARDETKQREIKEKAKKNAEDNKSTPPRSASTSVAATPADTKSKPSMSTTRNDSGPASPLASTERQPQQRSRQSSTNNSGPIKGGLPHTQPGQGSGHRPSHGNLGQRLAMNTQMNRTGVPQVAHPMPIPDPRIGQSGVTSPTSALRWDPTKSFVPSASSKPFVPGGSTTSSGSSPVRAPSSQPAEPKAPTTGNLFEGRGDGRKGPIPDSERVLLDNYFNPIPTLKKENEASIPEAMRANPPNGGLPPPHKTMPTWDGLVPAANKDKTYKDMFPNSLKPAASPQHTGPNQFHNQLPYGQHHGFVSQAGLTPNQTPRHVVAQPHHGGPGTPHHFEEAQRMQFSQSTSSVHPSPRPMQPYLYNAQTGPPGQQFPPMVYGTSPGGGYGMVARQLSNNPQFHGQGPQLVAAQGPPGVYMQAGMPAQMMYPAPGQTFFAHGSHMAPQPGTNGYPSPAQRPAMMAPQGSQSGHTTPQVIPYFGQQGPGQPIRYGGPPHHQQYPGNPQHFPQHLMRGAPSGSYPQPMMAGPQGMMMPAGTLPPDVGDDGK